MTSSSSPGRNAVHPEHIPRRGWWQIIKRVANKPVEQNASILSAGFSFYVSRFASYNETYGALGAIVVLLLWFYLTSYSIVLGAAFNAEAEHQTAQDTTVGGEQPMAGVVPM